MLASSVAQRHGYQVLHNCTMQRSLPAAPDAARACGLKTESAPDGLCVSVRVGIGAPVVVGVRVGDASQQDLHVA